jgi:hypothetical protein
MMVEGSYTVLLTILIDRESCIRDLGHDASAIARGHESVADI